MSNARSQVADWLTSPDSFFLIGAGCSVAANKPLMADLTRMVVEEAPEPLSEQFESLTSQSSRSPNVEDLMNYLLRYREVLSSLKDPSDHELSINEIDNWLTLIRRVIVEKIADDWTPSSDHVRFLRRIRSPKVNRPRDLFSLNYDTVLEASLDESRLPYVDGFRGTHRAWFDPSTLFDEASQQVEFRLHKLHGSINWTRDDEGYVRRGYNPTADARRGPVVVYPCERKYLQTQFGIHETMMMRFRERLRGAGANACLVVLGYSFQDDHINEALCDATSSIHNNLTVVTFVGAEDDLESQVSRLRALSERCDSRLNAFIGEGAKARVVGQAVDEVVARAITEAGLWRFEELVKFVAGSSP